MLRKKKNIFILSILLILISGAFLTSSTIFSQDAPFDVDEVITKIDEMRNYEGDFSMKVVIMQKKPDEKDTVKSAVVYRKDEDDKFLMIFTSPKVDAGKGYLYIDDNLWFYDPTEREFTRKTKSEGLGGTDTKSRDVESSSLEDNFDFEYLEEGSVGKIDCYVLWGKSKTKDIAYPYTKMWIRKDNYLPIKREEYSASEPPRLSQTVYYIKYEKKLDEKTGNYFYMSVKTLIADNLEKTKTLMEIEEISLDDLPDNIFTKDYLKSQS